MDIPSKYIEQAKATVDGLHFSNVEATSTQSPGFDPEMHHVIHPSDSDMMEDQDFIDDYLANGGYASLDEPDAMDDFETYISENYPEPEPIGSYWWPLEGRFDPDDVAKELLLASNNCCLVQDEDNDDYYFVLTGGGMDLSWDIAEAYVLAGQCPPATLRLPRYAGERWTLEKATTVLALEKSINGLIARLNNDLNDLRDTTRYISEQ